MATTETEKLTPKVASGGIGMHWIGVQWLDSSEHQESVNERSSHSIIKTPE